MIASLASRHSWFEATARARINRLLDAGSFSEILPPAVSQPSPHLAQLDLPGAFDDGVVIGYGQLEKMVKIKNLKTHLSISDEADYAVAYVILEQA